MRIGVPSEPDPHETRIAMTPETALRFRKIGAEVCFERGLGSGLGWEDAEFAEAGAEPLDRGDVLAGSDVLLRVGKPTPEDLAAIRPGTLHVGFLNPFQERDLVADLAKRGIRTVSMEMMPRSTIAQKMDALSSQHSLAGYYMVLLAAERLGKALPMMMTPAGTIQPARVFVIGAGVAGLQAIATAKRLGARVEAFDTRPVVAEQVQSLGARFLEIDLGETGQTDQGYATALTPEQEALQRQGMVSACARADIVITTAQLFGRPAPRVVTREMLAAMRPGAVVVDYAVESGGNVEGSVPGEEVRVEGVRVVGLRNYPGRVALDASRMYANNLYHFVASLWDADAREMAASGASEEILGGALITDGGAVVHPMVREHYGMED